jgi:hypothetical protein
MQGGAGKLAWTANNDLLSRANAIVADVIATAPSVLPTKPQ